MNEHLPRWEGALGKRLPSHTHPNSISSPEPLSLPLSLPPSLSAVHNLIPLPSPAAPWRVRSRLTSRRRPCTRNPSLYPPIQTRRRAAAARRRMNHVAACPQPATRKAAWPRSTSPPNIDPGLSMPLWLPGLATTLVRAAQLCPERSSVPSPLLEPADCSVRLAPTNPR